MALETGVAVAVLRPNLDQAVGGKLIRMYDAAIKSAQAMTLVDS
jgi:hypothetical protein